MIDLGGGICVFKQRKVEYHRAEFNWYEYGAQGKNSSQNAHLLLTTWRGHFMLVRAYYPASEEVTMLPLVRNFALQLGELLISCSLKAR